MATKEKKEIRLEKVLQDMSHSLNHIEDIMADDRELLVKLVKQNNTIVDYLKQLEVDIVEEYENKRNTLVINIKHNHIVIPIIHLINSIRLPIVILLFCILVF